MVIEEITGRIARDLEHLKQFTATPALITRLERNTM